MPVPDKVSGNNMDMDTVTVASIANVDPMFTIMCSVPENSPVGTTVCDPIKVMDPQLPTTR